MSGRRRGSADVICRAHTSFDLRTSIAACISIVPGALVFAVAGLPHYSGTDAIPRLNDTSTGAPPTACVLQYFEHAVGALGGIPSECKNSSFLVLFGVENRGDWYPLGVGTATIHGVTRL